jgi:plastocyanin
MNLKRRARNTTLGLIAIPLLSGCSPFFGQENADAVGGGEEVKTIAVTAVDVDFNPNRVVIPANQPVEIQLSNTGSLEHNFVIDALDVRVDLPPGESRTVKLEAPAGEYTYYCDKFGHRSLGMEGTLQAVK